MVHNEPFFLPVWLQYYSRFFAPEDIYVLDNETDDGSTATPRAPRIPVVMDRVDHTWMVETIEAKQRELLDQGYEVVLVTDVDELVVPVPVRGDLGTYMDTMTSRSCPAWATRLIHLPDREPPLDPDRPITRAAPLLGRERRLQQVGDGDRASSGTRASTAATTSTSAATPICAWSTSTAPTTTPVSPATSAGRPQLGRTRTPDSGGAART